MGTAIAQISIHQSRGSAPVGDHKGKRRLYTEDLQVGVRLYATFVPTLVLLPLRAAWRTMSSRLMRAEAPVRIPPCSAADRTGDRSPTDEFRLRLLFGCVDRSGGPKNVGCCYAVALASKPITAAGTTKALEDTVARQRLQYRLQISRWQTMPRFENFGRHTGCPSFCNATSTTAAMARSPLRESKGTKEKRRTIELVALKKEKSGVEQISNSPPESPFLRPSAHSLYVRCTCHRLGAADVGGQGCGPTTGSHRWRPASVTPGAQQLGPLDLGVPSYCRNYARQLRRPRRITCTVTGSCAWAGNRCRCPACWAISPICWATGSRCWQAARIARASGSCRTIFAPKWRDLKSLQARHVRVKLIPPTNLTRTR